MADNVEGKINKQLISTMRAMRSWPKEGCKGVQRLPNGRRLMLSSKDHYELLKWRRKICELEKTADPEN